MHRFGVSVANWHRELLLGGLTKRKRAEIAKSMDLRADHACQIRFSTHSEGDAHLVCAHVPRKALELLTDDQKAALVAPIAGHINTLRSGAKDSCALICVRELVQVGVLNSKYKAVPPPDVAVRFPTTSLIVGNCSVF